MFGTHYFYEDFHPNKEYDTRKVCEEFIDVFFGSDFHIRIRDYAMEHIRNFVELCYFYDSFEEFRNLEYEFIETPITPGECTRTAKISFEAVTSAGIKPIHFSGVATFELEYAYEFWTVIRAEFPGMPQ